jgi:hypothetical protein
VIKKDPKRVQSPLKSQLNLLAKKLDRRQVLLLAKRAQQWVHKKAVSNRI